METIKAVVTDLDGTLLTSRRTIHPQDIATAHRLRERGVRLFVATGRHPALVREYVRQLGGVDLAITCNGACLYDFARELPLEEHTLPRAAALRLGEFCRERELPYTVYTQEHAYFRRDDPRVQLGDREIRMGDGPVFREGVRLMEDWPQVLDIPLLKFCSVEMTLEQVDEMEAQFPDCNLEHYRGEHPAAEVGPAGCGKGPALERIAQGLGFSLAHTLALGDSYNDLSILSRVGYPAAPGNCCREVRELARYVGADNDHAPLTDAVRHFAPELLEP